MQRVSLATAASACVLLALAVAAPASSVVTAAPRNSSRASTVLAVLNEVDWADSAPYIVQSLTPPVHAEHPYVVLVGGTCGGSIVADRWVLTAAHCTLFISKNQVLAGTTRTNDGSGVRRAIKQLHLHPRFTVGPYWLNANQFHIKQVGARYDFMLVELESPLPLDLVTIASIPLDDQVSLAEGLNATFAGYGAKRHGETMQHYLHTRELTTMSNSACAKLPEFDSQDMICTKGRPPRFDSACNGDSGSGLVVDGRLVGVLSWVEDDAVTCRPGALLVSSRVAAAREWIRELSGV